MGEPEANVEMRAYWNSHEADHWVAHQHRYDQMLEPFTTALLDAATLAPGERVVDVGCGTGTTTLAAARAVQPGGRALGLDLSAPMVAHACRRAAEEGIEARFTVADAQVVPLPDDGNDVIISRFGVMFFDRPVDAFANLVAGLRPGGRVALAVWQDLFANEWMVVPTLAVAAVTRLPEPPAPGAPSPFSLGDPERAVALLTGAGLVGVQATPVTSPVLIGGQGTRDEVVDFMATTGMARMLLAEADPEQRTVALAALGAALEPFVVDDGVRMAGAAWLLTGHRP